MLSCWVGPRHGISAGALDRRRRVGAGYGALSGPSAAVVLLAREISSGGGIQPYLTPACGICDRGAAPCRRRRDRQQDAHRLADACVLACGYTPAPLLGLLFSNRYFYACIKNMVAPQGPCKVSLQSCRRSGQRPLRPANEAAHPGQGHRGCSAATGASSKTPQEYAARTPSSVCAWRRQVAPPLSTRQPPPTASCTGGGHPARHHTPPQPER